MTTNHLKRYNAPKTWPITRKATVFTLRPNPGGHPLHLSLPLSILLQDALGLAQTMRQVKTILNTQELLINGKRRRRPADTAGLMDVATFPATKTSYRILINTKNRLVALPIAGAETGVVPSKVTRKRVLPGAKLQLGFHNGRTLVMKTEGAPAIGSTLLLTLDNKVQEQYPLEKGAAVLVTGGKHVGKHGVLGSLDGAIATVAVDGGAVTTRRDLLFVIGKGKPAIKVI